MWKKISNDTIGNRTHDLPACRAVPQPTVVVLNSSPLWVKFHVTVKRYVLYVYIKLKQSHYRPGVAQKVPIS
jgi:hypothetical protein